MGFCQLQGVFSVFFGSSRSAALSPPGPAYGKAGREQAALLEVQNTPSPATRGCVRLPALGKINPWPKCWFCTSCISQPFVSVALQCFVLCIPFFLLGISECICCLV